MSEAAPAVALLFDDAELGARLREALCERGARIVHEGGVSSLDGERLRAVGADVIVVNLDDAAADALDSLYALLDGDRPRVVFNDAQASRALTGWDRERWARHLAVKALEQGDIDPPRPVDARGLGQPQADAAYAVLPASDASTGPAVGAADALPLLADDEDFTALAPLDGAENAAAAVADAAELERLQRANDESASLAAELEALLAAADAGMDVPAEEPATAAVDTEGWLDTLLASDEMDEVTDSELPPAPAPAEAFADFVVPDDILAEVPAAAALGPTPAAGLDELLARGVPGMGDDMIGSTPPAPGAAVSAPMEWALLDDDAQPSDILPRDRNDPASFGVEKLSAADFLAPDVEPVARGYEPVMSLELVSMEEAIAPRPISAGHEMHLDELHMALSRLVLTGAAADATESVTAFYAALPADNRTTFLHTQHVGRGDITALVAQLADASALPVRLASAGSFVRPGEVLVVPPGQQVRLHRDGRVELASAGDSREPSIDNSFTTAAETFGRDALAIVFSGRSVDAVAGAQAIHDRGGNVWVESAGSDHADMVNGISAERLANYSGTPQALAAHLIEVFS
jgi:two-component system chemotaxis response regulator CheB/chemosensory pili system protein ChpB (putative protein-glutamate methylesterase)